jgi:diadenosine tetraphosphatase ApaH/serine/threonine PP2A family protein phosphatase
LSYPLTALISDLHSNWPALEVALADARERGARRFVCLGDVIGYGAKPTECLDLVMRLCTERATSEGLEAGLCLQGNHEYALLSAGEDFNPTARRAIDWTREQINGGGGSRDKALEFWDFLGGLEPLQVEPGAMYAHGSPRDPVREYMLPRDARDADKMRATFHALRRQDRGIAGVCFVGHSHVPGIFYEDGRFYRPKGTEGPYDLGDLAQTRAIVNIGSVGQPRDGDKRLSYALFDGRNLTFVRLAYDVERAQQDIRSIPELPAYLADRLGVGQ